LQEKPAAVISASPLPFGAAGAARDLRKVLTRTKASVVGSELAVARASAQFREDGRLADPDLDRQLRTLVGDLIQAAGQRPAAA
jgi:NAD(P)H-dependent FMN reductase